MQPPSLATCSAAALPSPMAGVTSACYASGLEQALSVHQLTRHSSSPPESTSGHRFFTSSSADGKADLHSNADGKADLHYNAFSQCSSSASLSLSESREVIVAEQLCCAGRGCHALRDSSGQQATGAMTCLAVTKLTLTARAEQLVV